MGASVSVPASIPVYEPLETAEPEQILDSTPRSKSRHKHSARQAADATFTAWLIDPSAFAIR
jgi:hypothetical protein